MNSLRIYNTLTRDKQIFIPLVAGEVQMRWLRTLGYRVTYAQNITDIDDKIIRRALENGETIAALTARFTRAMHEDAAALGVERPDLEPRATEFVPQMLALIETLEKNGYAYQAADGDVNYAVRKFAAYGQLAGFVADDLRAGERVAANAAKQDPLDFVLWKRAKPDEPADTRWDSKWGTTSTLKMHAAG
ncbi:hypothetical protein BGZ96_012576 [Linnemannia gamsii]|uniref:tRNA synthetases class I catalytic domain-containing protein n=1 Tax=Linnemannia gamsii TaxID=64522 RepID=A0ABQ7KAG9_9FUNG|nr:hypothetical protein BGZ96_012576 [Linnemannia gamsii]